jgi:hypothetical protein
MANRLQVEFNLKNILIGIAFVLVAMLIFRLALPAIMPADAVLGVASAVVGVALWFLFLVSRNKAG